MPRRRAFRYNNFWLNAHRHSVADDRRQRNLRLATAAISAKNHFRCNLTGSIRFELDCRHAYRPAGRKRMLYQTNPTQLFGETCDSLLDALNCFG